VVVANQTPGWSVRVTDAEAALLETGSMIQVLDRVSDFNLVKGSVNITVLGTNNIIQSSVNNVLLHGNNRTLTGTRYNSSIVARNVNASSFTEEVYSASSTGPETVVIDSASSIYTISHNSAHTTTVQVNELVPGRYMNLHRIGNKAAGSQITLQGAGITLDGVALPKTFASKDHNVMLKAISATQLITVFDSNQELSSVLKAVNTPAENSQMSFELTNSNTLTVYVRDGSGVLKKATLALTPA
jgi:hypothetical protein